jgi:ADP-ribose pyrophosphatase YjhB (NUDIX family)
MARAPVLAAGGIVLRQEETPLIAVVRLRKRNEWVLPKGKLDDGETPRDAAEREVLEETGHDVSVHEFLGTLVYESGGRFKVVHYWRMETSGEPTHALMDDTGRSTGCRLMPPSSGCPAPMSARFWKMSDRSRWSPRHSPKPHSVPK